MPNELLIELLLLKRHVKAGKSTVWRCFSMDNEVHIGLSEFLAFKNEL